MLGALAGLLVALASPPGASRVELTWRAPAACPDAAAVHRRLREFAPEPPAGPVVRVSADVGRGVRAPWRLRLTLRGPELDDRRTIEAGDCRSLADVTALLIALAVAPEEVAARMGPAGTPEAAGGVPGAQPGAAPGGVPGAQAGAAPGGGLPGAQAGAAPGGVPGAQAGAAPGGVPGAQAGTAPGGGVPGAQASTAPGGGVPGAQASAAPGGGVPGAQVGVAPGRGVPGAQPGAAPGGVPGAQVGVAPARAGAPAGGVPETPVRADAPPGLVPDPAPLPQPGAIAPPGAAASEIQDGFAPTTRPELVSPVDDPALEAPPPRDSALAPDPVAPRRAPAPVRGAVRLGGGGEVGAIPAWSPAVGLAVGLFRGAWRVELAGTYAARALAYPEAAGIGGRMLVAAGAVRGCGVPRWRRLEFPVCAGVELGFVRAVARGVTDPQPARDLWIAAQFGPGIAWVPTRALAVTLGLDLLVGLRRPGFHVGSLGELARGERVGLRPMLGLEARFP